jgi:uncharacterized protein
MNLKARSFVLSLLRAYKWALSPFLLPACRYAPTCSEYAMEAVDRFGVFRGSFMAMRRVLRCHPFVQGGYDPVVKSDVVESEKYGAKMSSPPPASRAVTE